MSRRPPGGYVRLFGSIVRHFSEWSIEFWCGCRGPIPDGFTFRPCRAHARVHMGSAVHKLPPERGS